MGGQEREVYKAPITDPGKTSKKGRLQLHLTETGVCTSGGSAAVVVPAKGCSSGTRSATDDRDDSVTGTTTPLTNHTTSSSSGTGYTTIQHGKGDETQVRSWHRYVFSLPALKAQGLCW